MQNKKQTSMSSPTWRRVSCSTASSRDRASIFPHPIFIVICPCLYPSKFPCSFLFPRDPGSPNLRMVSWNLNTTRFVSVIGHPLLIIWDYDGWCLGFRKLAKTSLQQKTPEPAQGSAAFFAAKEAAQSVLQNSPKPLKTSCGVVAGVLCSKAFRGWGWLPG